VYDQKWEYLEYYQEKMRVIWTGVIVCKVVYEVLYSHTFILWHKVSLSVSVSVSVFLISAVSSQCSVYLFFENTHSYSVGEPHAPQILPLNKTIHFSLSLLCHSLSLAGSHTH